MAVSVSINIPRTPALDFPFNSRYAIIRAPVAVRKYSTGEIRNHSPSPRTNISFTPGKAQAIVSESNPPILCLVKSCGQISAGETNK